MFTTVLKKMLKHGVEGKFLDRVRIEINEWIGRFSRFLLRCITKVQDNKVLFHTQEDRYCCNQKYICEEFRRRDLGDKVDLVYVISKNGERGTVPRDVRTVCRGTLEYFEEMLSAKYLFTDSVL